MREESLAMVLHAPRTPLVEERRAIPDCGPHEVLLEVEACAVCRTDLHVFDGELPEPKLPLVLGHEIVGRVRAIGRAVERVTIGARLGVPWLGWADGTCRYCRSGQENLCDAARFTGYQLDGGYATHTVADARFTIPIPDSYPSIHAAPLLCAGVIGQRALSMTGDASSLGFYGFGASAHLLTQLAVFQGRRVFAFTKPGDERGQQFARSLGATWAGDSTAPPPEALDAAILFAPAGPLVPIALRAVRKGGIVVCAGIHMSDIPSFPYSLLWGERVVRSVANLTRADERRFFAVAPQIPVRTQVTTFPLARANEALEALRHGRFEGAAVLVP